MTSIPADFDAGLASLLDAIDVAVVVIDPNGVVIWANRPVHGLVGESVGRPFVELLPPHRRDAAAARFERMLGKLGRTPATDRLELLGVDGRRVEVMLRSMPLWVDDSLVGVVGIAISLTHVRTCPVDSESSVTLTPRQEQVLALLSEGFDTEAIATRLGVTSETARNHVRGLLARLGAHSRLEAVVAGRRAGFLDGR
jgi:PAS domain S-box-containing protein